MKQDIYWLSRDYNSDFVCKWGKKPEYDGRRYDSKMYWSVSDVTEAEALEGVHVLKGELYQIIKKTYVKRVI